MTATNNFNWEKPNDGDSSFNGKPWGQKIRTFMDGVDAELSTTQEVANAALTPASLSGFDGATKVSDRRTGASVIRSLHSINEERRSVLDYGAIPDGVTDNTAAFQDAADWASTNNIKRIYVPTTIAGNTYSLFQVNMLGPTYSGIEWIGEGGPILNFVPQGVYSTSINSNPLYCGPKGVGKTYSAVGSTGMFYLQGNATTNTNGTQNIKNVRFLRIQTLGKKPWVVPYSRSQE